MSNVSRHMQPSLSNAALFKGALVPVERAASRSKVLSRKAQLALPPSRAVRPAAAGAPSRMHHRCIANALRGCPSFGGQRTVALEVGSSAVCAATVWCAQAQVRIGGVPRPCEYAAPALLCSCVTAGIGHAAHAGGCFRGVGGAHWPQASGTRQRRAVCGHEYVTANPSVERTNNGGPRLAVSPAVRAPLFAAHLQR
jgi:hypothetical protein